MEKTTVILNEGPDSMKTWNGLRIAAGLIGVDEKVEIFLLDDGVYAGKKGQQPVEKLKELDSAAKLQELIGMGVKVSACRTCTEMKGLTNEELVDNIEVTTLLDLAKLIKESKHVLIF